jgi:hypothetical protein
MPMHDGPIVPAFKADRTCALFGRAGREVGGVALRLKVDRHSVPDACGPTARAPLRDAPAATGSPPPSPGGPRC